MKIIGMLSVYNEEDVIQEVIEHLISQEIPLVVLDNGSTDQTYEICKKFLGKGILKLEQFKSESYQWDIILRMLYDMALVHSPDWVIRSDSDELLESGSDLKLKDAINNADESGYTIIQFDRFDFFMTDDDNESANTVKEKFRYYSYQGDFIYRAWKYFPGIRIGDAGGHYPIFPSGLKYKISPKKFVLRHYPFRSKKQAELKIKYRVRGREKNKNDSALDGHEQKILNQDFSKKFAHNLLYKYRDHSNWEYKIKFCPFADPNPPRKENLFTKDGFLKEKPKTNWEYKLLLYKEKNRFFPRNIRRVKNLIKMNNKLDSK